MPLVLYLVLLALWFLLHLWVEPRFIPPLGLGDSFATSVSLIYGYPVNMLFLFLFLIFELFDFFKKRS